MEVNKDEAEKCLQIGAEAFKRGDHDRAIKFLTKSIRLYPLPGAEALLSQVKSQQQQAQQQQQSASSSARASANASASAAPRRSASTASSTTGADGREYTEEQTKIVKKVLRAKEGGRGAHYRVLGLEQSCSESEIKKAYRKLSLKVHPDKNSSPNADEAFKAVGLAYATLSDSNKRTIYDRYGEEDPDNVGGGMGGGMGGMGRRRGGGVHMNGQDVSPEEIFNMFFGGGGMPGGPGFHMHTTGFGPGMHFQQGGFGQPRRRGPAGGDPRRQRQQQQPQAQQSPSLGLLFQMLPLIMIMVMSFFRFGEDSTTNTVQNRYFSLTHNPPFVNPLKTKLTQVKEIPYFVSDKFLRTFYRDRYQLAQVERMVEKSYEQYLVDECDSQNRYKKSLQRKAALEKDPAEKAKKSQKANEFGLARCVELDDLFPNRPKKRSSRY
uniref:J domain-containing protein n=1 Tax=Entomoneis paludosa TaxID=265537 RepID=A0A7S3DTG2_9STRA|mmetsp:Transcript_34935/g.72758  ORF Transcript_34935/g.72758 Transcript_34935/m.72758 type:complete len:436 (+) Transcript_34935:2-1309(+)